MISLSGSIILADAGVWYAFANSDGMGKAIVLLLFLSSIVAWFIMIEKGLALYRAQKLSERFAKTFNDQHGLNSMLRDAMDNPCPVAKVYSSGMEQLLEFYGQTAEEVRTHAPARAGRGPRKLSPAQLDAVQTALEREVSGQVFVIEERIGVLATAVSLAPFLGLFGTVWGVMIAFCGVASAGSANIQALAPGVAGALLTTVAGLVVAIPSLIGYNTLTQLIRKITVSMDNFSESFMAQLKLEQLVVQDMESSKPAVSGVSSTQSAGAPSRPLTAAQIPVNIPQQQAIRPAANFGTTANPYTASQQQAVPSGNNPYATPQQQAVPSGNNPYATPQQQAAPSQMSFGNFTAPENDPANSMRD